MITLEQLAEALHRVPFLVAVVVALYAYYKKWFIGGKEYQATISHMEQRIQELHSQVLTDYQVAEPHNGPSQSGTLQSSYAAAVATYDKGMSVAIIGATNRGHTECLSVDGAVLNNHQVLTQPPMPAPEDICTCGHGGRAHRNYFSTSLNRGVWACTHAICACTDFSRTTPAAPPAPEVQPPPVTVPEGGRAIKLIGPIGGD